MDVVVQPVPEARREAGRGDNAVVCSEDGRQLQATVEVLSDTHENVLRDDDIGVDEDDQLGRRPRSTQAPGDCRARALRLLHDEHLVRRLVGREQHVDATLEGRR